MAVQTIVLSGNRLYDVPTYSTNQDPESLTANLSDSTSLTDTDFKFVKDAISIVDNAITRNSIKALAESLSMSETRLVSALKHLADAIITEDSSVLIQQIKGFSEFIRVKDWIELKLDRAGIWQSTPAFGFAPSQIHLYGPNVYYGFDYYAANPSVNWLLTALNSTTWLMTEAATQSETLYAQTLFSQSLFGSVPAVGWTNPISTAQQAWTNNNGESHN